MEQRIDGNKMVISKTIVGSHLWGMENKDSDVDYFEVFAYPTSYLLRGHHPKMSYFYHGDTEDMHSHEIEKVIGQLVKGNINFVEGVISPLIVETSEHHEKLRDLLIKYPPKNIYHSVRGMAVHNYNKLYSHGEISGRSIDKVLRVIKFGITLLESGRYVFSKYVGGELKDIPLMLKELDNAYESSELDNIPEDMLRDILYDIRMEILEVK